MSSTTGDKALTQPWMLSLIKAQAVMDSGVRLAVRQESQLRGAGPACRDKCSSCCRQREPQATAVETAGALSGLLKDSSPQAVEALRRFRSGDGDGCPFLVEGSCRVHAMRPLSCRRLVVFGRACLPDEDPWRARSADLLIPLRQHACRAYSLLLPHLGGSAPHDPLELEPLLCGLLKPPGGHASADLALFLHGLGLPAPDSKRWAA